MMTIPWDRAAEGWSRNATIVNAWLHDVTHAMLDAAGVALGSRVLDVAAGAGGQTLAVAQRVGTGGYVLATDLSAEILALARANLLGAGLHNVETRVADAQALNLAGGAFDAAVCRMGLMFCAQPRSALAEIRSALRPSGRLAAVVFSGPQTNPCVAILLATARRHAGLSGTTPYRPGMLFSLGKPGLMAQLLEEEGFSDIAVRPVAAPFRLPTATHYVNFIRSSASPVMEILAPLSERAKAVAWDDMAAQLSVFDGPDGWEGPNELLLCSACSSTNSPSA
jgi:ubiquinone/menaquinone biosynthesis C-methylase UbiE